MTQFIAGDKITDVLKDQEPVHVVSSDGMPANSVIHGLNQQGLSVEPSSLESSSTLKTAFNNGATNMNSDFVQQPTPDAPSMNPAAPSISTAMAI